MRSEGKRRNRTHLFVLKNKKSDRQTRWLTLLVLLIITIFYEGEKTSHSPFAVMISCAP